MPSFDLRSDGDLLDPLTPYKVLAVMCHPGRRDRHLRERMVARVQADRGATRTRRRPISQEEFMRQVRHGSARAAVAGGVLLTRLQLQLNGDKPSFNWARPLVLGLLPLWEQPIGPHWSEDAHLGHRPRTRPRMLKACNDFRPVAHLWAAMIHGLQHSRDDIWPFPPGSLPTFLAYADCFLDLACALPSPDRKRRFAMTRSEAWTFTLPTSLHRSIVLEALPFTVEQRRILDQPRSKN
jgi:hypothetical protein